MLIMPALHVRKEVRQILKTVIAFWTSLCQLKAGIHMYMVVFGFQPYSSIDGGFFVTGEDDRQWPADTGVPRSTIVLACTSEAI